MHIEGHPPDRAVKTPKLLSLTVLLTVLSTLIGLGACGSGQSNPAENRAGQPRTITGTEIVSYVSETGTVDVPDDLSQTAITAYVPNGSGGYDAIQGSGTSDGHYTIPSVPAGSYLLQIGSSYFWTSATAIDTGSQVQGRPNPAQAPIGESLRLNIALSVPAASYDSYELTDFNTNAFWPMPSSTSGNTISGLFYWPYGPLIQASMGDKAYFSHVNLADQSQGAGQIQYISATQAEMTPALSIEMAPGVVSDLNSAMTQGTSGVFRANFGLSAFSALNSQIATTNNGVGNLVAGLAAVPPFAVNGGFPDVSLANAELPRVNVEPDPPAGALGTLATFNIVAPSPYGPDLDLGDVNYQNGFPATYKSLVFAYWGLPLSFTVPMVNGNYPGDLNASIIMNSLTTPTANRPISPLLGPVTNLSLDSADVFSSPLTNTSLTPNITWSPPNLGNASFYQVDLLQFTVGQCRYYACAQPTNVATFQSQQTNLRLPPGILMPGSTYIVVVTAKNAVALDLNSAPLRTTYPFAYADTVSQPIMTAGTAPAEIVGVAHINYGPLARNKKGLLKKK
jgi:hypothetical protein